MIPLCKVDFLSDIPIPTLENIQEATCEQALWISQRSDVQNSVDETTVKNPKFSEIGYDLLKKLIQRTVNKSGVYPWQTPGF